jgi:nicotinamide mononucleotide transporter
VLYTFLYLRQSPWSFLFGGLGAALFVWLCIERKIYAEAFLQLFYIGFAVYGFLNLGAEWKVYHSSFLDNLPMILAGIAVTFLAGWLMKNHTSAKLPYWDAFTTAFALIATWIMVNYIHENWLYWIVIDAVSIWLYAKRKMFIGSALFVLYLLMAIDGYFEQIAWFQ